MITTGTKCKEPIMNYHAEAATMDLGFFFLEQQYQLGIARPTRGSHG
jgi:hypothetical protein